MTAEFCDFCDVFSKILNRVGEGGECSDVPIGCVKIARKKGEEVHGRQRLKTKWTKSHRRNRNNRPEHIGHAGITEYCDFCDVFSKILNRIGEAG